MICIGCGCSEFSPCDAGGVGCHWATRNPPVCSECVELFDEAEFSGPACENITGANENAPLVCPHTRRLYVDGTTFKCVSCDSLFHDEEAA